MMIRSFRGFLRDERGSYTVWSLIWFVMFVAIGGLAVDGTDGYRTKTLLQSTADASALAAAMSLRAPDEDPVVVALAYAEANMDPDIYGVVVTQDDVVLGTWDIASQSFTAGTADPNAVYVVARRAEENGNPLIMNMLRILQLFGLNGWWNINADALAVVGLEACQNNGIIAGGTLEMTTDASFYNGVCLHGVEGIKHTNGNYFEPGVSASVGCQEGDENCLMPNERLALSDPDFADAFDLGGYGVDRQPVNAQSVGNYIELVIELAMTSDFDLFLEANNSATIDYTGLGYLADSEGNTSYYEGPTLPEDAVTPLDSAPEPNYTVYKVNCASNDTLDLPSGNYRNMAIIFTCPIQMNSSTTVDMKDVLIAVDWVPDLPEDWGMKFAGNAILGATECGEGGVDLMTRNSSVRFAAGGQINNSRLLSGYNVHFAAGGAGMQGVHVEAVNNIKLASDATFGLCPVPADNVPQHLVYTLVR